MQLFLGHITGNEFQLDAAEVQHCVKVLTYGNLRIYSRRY